MRVWVAGTFLAMLHVCVFFAGFFAPYNPAAQNRDLPYAPPTKIHLVDRRGRFHARPFVHPTIPDAENYDMYLEDNTRNCPLRLLVRGDGYTVGGMFHSNLHMFGVDE